MGKNRKIGELKMALRSQDILNILKKDFNDEILASSTSEHQAGVKNPVSQNILTVKLSRRIFHRAVSRLKSISPIHVATPMATIEYENNKDIELVYVFTLFFGQGKFKELPIIIKVPLPRDDMRIRTLTDIIPGILLMERETIEMFGIQIEDIPDNRRFLTPDTLPTGFNPLKGKLVIASQDSVKNAGEKKE